MKKFTLHYYSYSYLLHQHKHRAAITVQQQDYTLKPTIQCNKGILIKGMPDYGTYTSDGTIKMK
jgi:hypothetical protein